MERPRTCSISINWVDEKGIEYNQTYCESELEEVADLIGLMIGTISEEDLKP